MRHLAIVFLGMVMSGITNGGPQGMNRAPMVNGVSGEKSEVQITNVIDWWNSRRARKTSRGNCVKYYPFKFA